MTKLQKFNSIMEKLAASVDDEFEQSFFQLAYERLQDKLNNLLPFLVGFEIVNKNDEGTKALGVFGFKSNNGQMMFVPAFFINGTVKGIDLLYSKNNEQFYPLNEDFAELFLKDEVTGIGDTSHEDRNEINQRMTPVNLEALSRPPKTASIKHTSLLDFVEDGDKFVKKAFYKFFSEDKKFCESVLRFYDLEKVAKALVIRPKQAEARPEPEIRLFKKGQDLSMLNDSQKLAVLNDGYFILDKRAEDKKSKIGLFKYTESFSNPSSSGFYSYITQRGSLRYGLVLVKPVSLRKDFSSAENIVLDLDANKQGQAYRVGYDKLFVKGPYKVKDFSSIHSSFEEPAEVTPSFDTAYVLINPELKATEEFKVVANYKNEEGLRVVEIEPRYAFAYGPSAKKPNSFFDQQDIDNEIGHNRRLIFTKKQGDFEFRGATVLVPKGYKLLEVKFGAFGEQGDFSCSMAGAGMNTEEGKKSREAYEANKPGSLSDLNASLRSDSVFPFAVNSNGSEFFATVGTMKKKYSDALSAKIGMVLDFGLGKEAADEVVTAVNQYSSKSGQIKLAYTGDQNFSLRDPQAYANMLGQPTYEDYGYAEQMPADQVYTNDPTAIGRAVMPEVQGINDSINTANNLADNGQKQIFDTQAIATLSKYVSPQTKTTAYMPEYISCLDKLGRMLFLTYWETEKFEEMYGRSEMPDLIELLTGVFKDLGDLVIFLKRKSPELSINVAENEGAS